MKIPRHCGCLICNLSRAAATFNLNYPAALWLPDPRTTIRKTQNLKSKIPNPPTHVPNDVLSKCQMIALTCMPEWVVAIAARCVYFSIIRFESDLWTLAEWMEWVSLTLCDLVELVACIIMSRCRWPLDILQLENRSRTHVASSKVDSKLTVFINILKASHNKK